MNSPTRAAVDRILVSMGSDSTQLEGASIGLIGAPFSPGPALTLAAITEANYSGYARQGIGNPTIPFTGSDGHEYVEGTTRLFQPSDTVTVNTIYGSFLTTGSGTTTLFSAEPISPPLPMAGPSNAITITPRIGITPGAGLGNNVVSN